MHETAADTKPALGPPMPSSKGSEDHPSHPDQMSEVIGDSIARSRRSSITVDGSEKNDPEDPSPLSRQSTQLEPDVEVPRGKRRGLFAQLALVAEIEDPKTYSRKMKWFITFIVAWAGAMAPMGSSIFFRESFIPVRNTSVRY